MHLIGGDLRRQPNHRSAMRRVRPAVVDVTKVVVGVLCDTIHISAVANTTNPTTQVGADLTGRNRAPLHFEFDLLSTPPNQNDTRQVN